MRRRLLASTLGIALVCVVTLTPTSPGVDFSYDFQDLLLKAKKTP